MKSKTSLQKYTELLCKNLMNNDKILNILKSKGLHEKSIFDNFNLGYANGNLLEIIGNNKEQKEFFHSNGIIKNNKEIYSNHLTIPILDENKIITNILFYEINIDNTNQLPPA